MLNSHGISIGIERHKEEFFVALEARGKLTHEDYKAVTPMLESALAVVENPHIKALVDVRGLEGLEPRAAWDDLKLGLKHGGKFERIAILGSKKWHQAAAKVGDWFISGNMEQFEDESRALSWLFGAGDTD